MSFTEQQVYMLEQCKRAGYGWSKFATNVEKQGFCSQKQEYVLRDMTQRIKTAQSNKTVRRVRYKHDISDYEAMRFGEFF